MKIYTKTGDDGTTGLVGGQRVSKSDARIECYGTVDELNAAVGLAAAAAIDEIRERLLGVQHELFIIGALLATPEGRPPKSVDLPELQQSAIDRLERQIDSAEAELPVLRNFILPGGCESSARLHLARTICRRGERLLVALTQSVGAGLDPILLKYLNRLSDWLFVQARLANLRAGVSDIPWHK